MKSCFLEWRCPSIHGSGLFVGLTLIALACLLAYASLAKGVTVRGALARKTKGQPATVTQRVIFFIVGLAAAWEGLKMLLLC
jgi:membrane-associated phospholipid phosphatase